VLVGGGASAHHVLVGVASAAAMAILSIDLAGTTPWYGSYINTFRNRAQIELVADRCTGAADCVQVCPRGVLEMNGAVRKAEIVRPDDCIQCGACIVQCPTDALRFRYDDGRIVEPATIRRTRMNMVGRRTVEVDVDRAA
jgi:NAD-dependent dihydropyrimidine dehydrogenase PreA subunit